MKVVTIVVTDDDADRIERKQQARDYTERTGNQTTDSFGLATVTVHMLLKVEGYTLAKAIQTKLNG